VENNKMEEKEPYFVPGGFSGRCDERNKGLVVIIRSGLNFK
jgi:hypothetical protein